MTYQEVSAYLKDHAFLIFRVNGRYYSIHKSRRLFSRYILRTAQGDSHTAPSLHGLLDPQGVPPLQDARIVPWGDPALDTYEGIRHLVTALGLEVRFLYHGEFYWITHTKEGQALLSKEAENPYRLFPSPKELFEKAQLEGKSLEEIWAEVAEVSY